MLRRFFVKRGFNFQPGPRLRPPFQKRQVHSAVPLPRERTHPKPLPTDWLPLGATALCSAVLLHRFGTGVAEASVRSRI